MTKPKGPPADPAPRPPKAPAKGEKAFDVWLKRGLQDLYGKVVTEDLPEELLRIIEQDRGT